MAKEIKEWKNPYLIQRLEKPFDDPTIVNPFSFGGGLVNGGLSKDAMKLLSPIMAFDYMGSAEFEWGAVPKAFGELLEIRKDNHLKKGEIKVNVSFKDYSSGKTVEAKLVPVYYICRDMYEHRVIEYISKTAKGDSDTERRLKERTAFRDSVTNSKYSENIYGWLELDNPFMFFKDKTMFENVCKLYDLQ